MRSLPRQGEGDPFSHPKRKAAEKELKARKKLWDEMSAVLKRRKQEAFQRPLQVQNQS